MRITDKTKLGEIAGFVQYFDQSSQEDMKNAAERKFGSVWGLTIGNFFACAEGDFGCVGIDVTKPEVMTALQFYWVQAFKDMCETLTATLERLSVPQSADARRASSSCLKVTFKEAVMLFCREYFGLSNFAQVNDLTIDDFLLAKKDAFNKAMFEKTMADIQSQKYKQKK